MSKDLEREYRALVNREAPDLWARIEAGLDEKENVNKGIEKDIVRKKNFPVKVWATVAAACVCVGLIIPVMKSRMSGGGSSYSAAPSDFSNNAQAYEMEMADGAKAADTGIVTNGIDNSAYDRVSEDAYDAAAAEGAAYDGGDEVQEAAEEIYTFQAVVEIKDTDVRMDSQIVYTAKVLSCDSPDLQENSEIRIVASITSDNIGDNTFLEQGRTYELTLCGDDSGEELTYRIMNS